MVFLVVVKHPKQKHKRFLPHANVFTYEQYLAGKSGLFEHDTFLYHAVARGNIQWNVLEFRKAAKQFIWKEPDHIFPVTESYTQKQQQEDPCQTKSRVVGDLEYCDRYWECVNGRAELFDCPNGLVFAGKHRGVTEGCDYPWRANYCDGKRQANPPIPAEHCDWLYGIFGHETSCTRYWTCWNGTATEQLCIGGLLYNERARSCDWPENVEGCQKHPLCNDDANGNVPLGKSCNRYWQCQGGYPRLQRCPAMLVFDRRSLRCVVPPTEDCDVPTTPPNLEGDLPEGRNEQEPEEENLPPGVPPLPAGALPISLRSRPRN
ncbi:Chondroitin proteoglycan-2 [Habropoda laboriosa]|uniref:Chondroitin proteoglycan-2 n=1 Tax=Habropoda laboriosa TaxID=597456 RepID=A0A0L7QP97_9HYME|nr:Chondroitin proteoglycan-2 [Habropoda laboriosa]